MNDKAHAQRTACSAGVAFALAVLALTPLTASAADGASARTPPGYEPPARSFFADRRAHAVGDMLTVMITEFSTVEARAHTSTDKSEGATASLQYKDSDLHVASADFDSNFAGGGQIERSGKLIAKLAVTVAGVYDRGNLLVHGEQDIQINNERQRIRLDGTVRPEDIGPDNTIASYRVGAARIEFTGKGLLARKQAPGILTRILSWFWE